MRGFPLWSFVSATVRRLSSSIFFLLFGFVFFFNTVTTGQGRTTKRVISWATDRLVISLITEPRLKKNVRHLLFVFQKNQNGRRQNRGGGSPFCSVQSNLVELFRSLSRPFFLLDCFFFFHFYRVVELFPFLIHSISGVIHTFSRFFLSIALLIHTNDEIL